MRSRSQASSDAGGRARTSLSKRKRIEKKDLNDSVENTRNGILRFKQSTSTHVAQENAHVKKHAASTPAVKPSGSGINSISAGDVYLLKKACSFLVASLKKACSRLVNRFLTAFHRLSKACNGLLLLCACEALQYIH